MQILVVVGIGIAAYLWYVRSQELFNIRVQQGKQTVVRGFAPAGLLGNFADALKNVHSGTVRAHKTANGARLSFSGIDERTAQRLRNIFGLYPMAQLTAPRVDGRQAVSDAFTLSWLLSLIRQFFR